MYISTYNHERASYKKMENLFPDEGDFLTNREIYRTLIKRACRPGSELASAGYCIQLSDFEEEHPKTVAWLDDRPNSLWL